jgi:hypothetical protein
MSDISEVVGPAEETADVHNTLVGLMQGCLSGLPGKSSWPSDYIKSPQDGRRPERRSKAECLELEKK